MIRKLNIFFHCIALNQKKILCYIKKISSIWMLSITSNLLSKIRFLKYNQQNMY